MSYQCRFIHVILCNYLEVDILHDTQSPHGIIEPYPLPERAICCCQRQQRKPFPFIVAILIILG